MENNNHTKKHRTLTDWAIVLYPEIYANIENPDAVFANTTCLRAIALFGRAENDSRHNAKYGAFSDGNRLITSELISVKNGEYHTENSVYILDPDEKNEAYAKWCAENPHEEAPLSDLDTMDAEDNTLLLHICEVCGKQEILSSEEGFEKGWDYPPKMGTFGVASPRTCGSCPISETLWWDLAVKGTMPNQLSERHRRTLAKILAEPDNILHKS